MITLNNNEDYIQFYKELELKDREDIKEDTKGINEDKEGKHHEQ